MTEFPFIYIKIGIETECPTLGTIRPVVYLHSTININPLPYTLLSPTVAERSGSMVYRCHVPNEPTEHTKETAEPMVKVPKTRRVPRESHIYHSCNFVKS